MSFNSLTVISPLIIITSMTDFVNKETLFQGQKIGFSNPTVLQSDSNLHFTNRVGLSRLDCINYFHVFVREHFPLFATTRPREFLT